MIAGHDSAGDNFVASGLADLPTVISVFLIITQSSPLPVISVSPIITGVSICSVITVKDQGCCKQIETPIPRVSTYLEFHRF